MRRRNKCLCCGSRKLTRIMELGAHPFADTFILKSQLKRRETILPLNCLLCRKCKHIQTEYFTNPRNRYNAFNYSYTSANSRITREHWIQFAKTVAKKTSITKSSFVLEIGSNDGFLVKQFSRFAKTSIGIDASKFMVKLANKNNAKTISGFFNRYNSSKITKKYGYADLIVANNVFNHADEPRNFLDCISRSLKEGGYFVFEVPYWLYGVKKYHFDLIYHEHVNYFTVTSMEQLLDQFPLQVQSVDLVNFHGKSLRVVAQKTLKKRKKYSSLQKYIMQEKKEMIFAVGTYKKFMNKIKQDRKKFLEEIGKIKDAGIRIVGIGAAAKANTFLNFYNLDNQVIDFITDTSEYKIGKYTPKSRIPIYGDERLVKKKNIYAIVLTWNFSVEFRKKLLKLNPAIRFKDISN